MKTTKKLLALALALAMVLTLTGAALATTVTSQYTLTIDNSDAGYTYEAYAIFTGDLSGDNPPYKLSNVAWGSGITEAGQKALADKYSVTYAEGEAVDAAKVADALAGKDANEIADIVNANLGTVNKTVSATPYTFSFDKPGYYFVKNTAVPTGTSDTEKAFSDFIVQVVGPVSLAPKSAFPTVDKLVHDEEADAEENSNAGWGKTADHSIGETFQFKLIGTLPTDVDFKSYSAYKVVFHDTLSAGVSFDSIVSVKVGTTEVPVKAEETAGYVTTAPDDAGKWTLTIDNIKAFQDDLARGATIEVIYNAHLNKGAYINTADGTTTNQNDVYLEYSNNPNGDDTGKTPEKSVWVFTYQVNNTKVDATVTGQQTPLADAGFRLYDSTGMEVALIYDNTLAAYRPVLSGESGVEMKSAADGKFNIAGLDAGTYTLKETTVPNGYNKCDNVTIVISATHKPNDSGVGATTLNMAESTLNNIVENKQGATLPTTGGMGTTLFYVLGSVLVLGAVVLLVSKKRMSKAE